MGFGNQDHAFRIVVKDSESQEATSTDYTLRVIVDKELPLKADKAYTTSLDFN